MSERLEIKAYAQLSDDEILDLELLSCEWEECTIRDYFKALLAQLLREGEAFSGKRPFGSSDWMWQLAEPLALAGLIDAEWDIYGEERYLRDADFRAADDILVALVDAL